MPADAEKKASGLVALLLTPVRARAHVAEKLGARWAVLADSLILGGALGLIIALALDVPGQVKLGVLAAAIVLAAIAGLLIGRKTPKQPNDTQP